MNPVKCPICHESEPVLKASAIYIAALEVRYGKKPAALDPDGELGEPPPGALLNLNPAELQALGKRLKPPVGGKKSTFRPIHPDMLVGVFSVIAVFFLYQIFTLQTEALPVALGSAVVFYAFYFWQRKRLIAKHYALVQEQKDAQIRSERTVKRWMGLYYCVADDVVFTIAGHKPVPADQMYELL